MEQGAPEMMNLIYIISHSRFIPNPKFNEESSISTNCMRIIYICDEFPMSWNTLERGTVAMYNLGSKPHSKPTIPLGYSAITSDSVLLIMCSPLPTLLTLANVLAETRDLKS